MKYAILVIMLGVIVGCEGKPNQELGQYQHVCRMYDRTTEDSSTQIEYPCTVTQHERVVEWKDAMVSPEGEAGSIRWRKKRP